MGLQRVTPTPIGAAGGAPARALRDRCWWQAVCLAALLAAAGLASGGCGGGGSSPTSPSPTPTPSPSPSLDVCRVVSSGAASTARIVNGTVCASANTPVVRLNLRDKDGFQVGRCSGTVIAPRAVLTAAHCLTGETESALVWPGSGDQVPSSSLHPHPRYRATDSSSLDVGLILTAQDLGRAPLPVLLSRDARVGEQAVIAGWGQTASGFDPTNVLRAGSADITAVGAVWLETRYSSTSSSICSGDSGGPLLLAQDGAWAVAGVSAAVSQGGSCTAGTNYYANLRNPDIAAFITGLVPAVGQR